VLKRKKVLKFIKSNPNMKIPDLYNFAKNNKLFQEELNEIIISLLKEYIDYTVIKKISNEVEAGIKVEKEHKSTYIWLKEYQEKNDKFPPEKEFYERIAKNHNDENKNYYSFLIDLESKMEKGIIEAK
jgi:hypothetical protein